MRCTRCHQENPSQAKFCLECGTALALKCATCGTELPAGAKFCLECGQSVSTQSAIATRFTSPGAYTPQHLAEKILTSKSALEGERKQVTVLFADMKGSMELLADRDPEEARKILDPILEHMMEAVHRYEGTVNQVMGDGIMALFGAPLAHEDHAVRACYAALRMQESVKRYAEGVRRTEGIPIQTRVGLNSGEVVVRSIGSDLKMDYTAIGQTTHLAARMEQMATPGSILITPVTLRLAEGYVQVKSLGPVNVKGLPEPVEVYEVAGVGATRSRLQAAAARGLTRFVGRDTEIEHLRKALEQAQTGHGQVIAIVGEPGVGKSRLFYEFTHSHRTQGWLIVESGSASYGKATPYLPLIDLLKAYFKIHDRDNQREIREKVTGKLLTLDESLRPTLPAFLALLNLPVEDQQWHALDPPQRRQRTLDACKRLLFRESQAQPLLLLFEDLHWLDSETQTVLDSLVESLPTARLLLLVNYRPEYQHSWASKTFYSQLRLDPLATESAEELLRSLLGNDPSLQTLKQLLITRTEGNPFFLEESVRTLVETRVLEGERSVYRLAKPIDSIEVPATVQAVLAARIDRLSPQEKRLLQSASVIGEDIPFMLLSAIAELPEEELRRGLVHLQAAEFLYEAKLFPDLEYTFKHGLTCQVAYGSLLQDRRRSMHAAVVEGIERLYAGRLTEQAERLAYHALRGEVWDKAVSYLRQAGTKATERSAHREAVSYLEQALDALKHLPEGRDTVEQAIDIRTDLRSSLQPLGEQRRVFDYLTQAEAIAKSLDDPRRLAQILCYMSGYFIQAENDPARAIEASRQALAIATNLGDFTLLIQANHFLGAAYRMCGNDVEAMRFLRTNIESLVGDRMYERFGLAFLASVGARYQLALLWAGQGQFGEAAIQGEEAVRIAATANHPFSIDTAYFAVGYVQLRRGAIDKAISMLESSLEVCRAWGLRQNFTRMAAALAYAYATAGRVAEAFSLLDLLTKQSNIPSQFFGLLGESYFVVGRVEDAIHFATRALEFSRRHKARSYEATALRLLGDINTNVKPPAIDKAENCYVEAMAIAEEFGMRPLLAHCHAGLGKLYGKTGNLQQAKAYLNTGVALMREMEMGFWLEKAETELNELG
jgi:class 3 adenylate cyclase/tetratricopeptide (TPR) repeat protein